MLEDDTRVFDAYVHAPPRVGEYLWVTGDTGAAIVRQHGTTSFIVEEVAHWIAPDFVPHDGKAIHSIAVYVKLQIQGDEN